MAALIGLGSVTAMKTLVQLHLQCLHDRWFRPRLVGRRPPSERPAPSTGNGRSHPKDAANFPCPELSRTLNKGHVFFQIEQEKCQSALECSSTDIHSRNEAEEGMMQ